MKPNVRERDLLDYPKPKAFLTKRSTPTVPYTPLIHQPRHIYDPNQEVERYPIPGNLAAAPSCASILKIWLYLDVRSPRHGALILICPVSSPTAKLMDMDSEKVSAPVGMMKNSWKARRFPACSPPLIMLKQGTGRRSGTGLPAMLS